jgi:hypothetical protein
MKALTSMRRFGWVGALLFLALGAGLIWSVRATHEIALAQTEIQNSIDARLGKEIPVEGAAQPLLRSIRIQRATVTLGDGKAALAVEMEGALRAGKSVEIDVAALGVPRYAEGALYFDPEQVNVRRLSYEGASASELVSRLARGLGANDKARAFLEGKAQKADDWALAAAQTALRRFLEERPVYRLKDDAKGAAAKAALQKISVEGDRIVVTFSLWRLTAGAILGFFSLLFGLILAVLAIRMLMIGEDADISIE